MTPQQLDRFMLDGIVYRVDPQAQLGSGSEGLVIEHPTDPELCIKLFHPGEPGDKAQLQIALYRAKKVLAICGQKIPLPVRFMLPIHPAYDIRKQDIRGFDMRRVPLGYYKLLKLIDATFRIDHKVSLAMVALLFDGIFDDLQLVHDKNFRIGDVNLGCILMQPDTDLGKMFKEGVERDWVDTDSWSIPGFPCLATTELFAHPDLYVNLQSGGKKVPPEPKHDRFAFLLAFTMIAIPGAHPFRMGSHPKVKGLQNRTNAGITIFDSDVKYPALLMPPEVLSDELLQEIIERLKRRTDAPLSRDLLRTFASEVIECSKCGTEYHKQRRQCPKCHEATKVVQMPQIAAFQFEKLFTTKGVLLYVQLIEKELFLVCRIGKEVQVFRIDEKGTSIQLSPALPVITGARYRFFANCLVVCPEPSKPAPAHVELYRIDGNILHQLEGTTTGVLSGESAVFDTSSRFLYRTAGNALMCATLFGASGMVFDTPIAQVHQSQSWFTADHASGAEREMLIGYDRALRNWNWFVIVGNTKGNHFNYYEVGDLGVRTGEIVEDFAVYFSANSVLLVAQTTYQGRDYIRYAIIGIDGKVQLNKLIDDSDSTFLYWSNLRGKFYQGKSVLHLTHSGIVKQQFSDDNCSMLDDTVGVVSADDRLIRLIGKVGIVSRSGVSTMTSKK